MKLRMIRQVVAFASAIAIVYVIGVFGPSVEARFFPVMKYPAVVTKIDPAGQNAILIWGHSRRLRECNFIKLEWFYGERDGRAAAVRVEFIERPKVREKGYMDFGPWRLHVPFGDLSNTYADALHLCKWFGLLPSPWYVRSPFY